MRSWTTALMQTVLSGLHYSGMSALLSPFTRGKGVIFTLHNVRPEPPKAFEPNRILKITPEFLETAIEAVRDAGYDMVSLDEAVRRMNSPVNEPPFACFTLDDGYKDNRDVAYPIFKKHGVPFAIYIPTAYPDGGGELWWLVLEAAIRKASEIRVVLDGTPRFFATRTAEEKNSAFCDIYWSLRKRPETELRTAVREIADQAGYDHTTLCRDLIMDWDELRTLAADPLVTIGAHTRRHFAIARLPEDEARAEIAGSIERIEQELDRPCRHFSFPYGDACSAGERDFAIAQSLGLASAVTTHKDVLRAKHVMTGLPRISLNGDYQKARYVSVMMTGLPSLIFDTAQALLRRAKDLRGTRLQPGGAARGDAATRPGAASI